MHNANNEIKSMWRIFAVGDDSVLEMRAIWPSGVPNKLPPATRHFRAAEYTSLADLKTAFEKSALALNAQGFNIYTTLNPIRADFAGPGCAKDQDIRYRDLLLIDIDRIGDTSCPATDEELTAARNLAMVVRGDLRLRGWAEPIVVMSGNGYHLYYVLDCIENSPEAKDMMAELLHDLADRFNTDVVGIDTTVFNASRITKVPGTIARKGQETPERPYRIAEVCDE